MRALLALLFATLALTLVSPAGEKPAIHLTGNPSVDFFSDPNIVANHSWSLLDTTLPNQGEFSATGDKSPWLAAGMSAVIPGAGEFYAKSYVKAAVFVAVEAASWIVAYAYNKKGDNQTDDFQNYANLHWSASKYADWVLNNLSTLNPAMQGQQQSYGDLIYREGYNPQDPPSYLPPYLEMNWKELNAMEDVIRAVTGNGFSHLLPDWNDQQFYELIGKYSQFRTGWDDDQLQDGQLPLQLPANGHMITYRDMRAQANSYYDVASTMVSVAVINHIVSALDAFWSVTRYNKNLHAELRMHAQPTPVGVVPITEATFRFDF